MRARYLRLLKQSVLGKTYEDNELRLWFLRRATRGKYDERLFSIREYAPRIAQSFLRHLDDGTPFDGDVNNLPFTHTMVGRLRLDNVERCAIQVLEEGIDGDWMECGVWRGGVVVLLRGILAAYEDTDRIVWVADSFEGLPPPTAPEDVAEGSILSKDAKPALAVDLATVKRAFEGHELLDHQVRFLPGWFSKTLPSAPVEKLSLLRVDGDMYSSTRDVLDALYDKVVPGGFIIVDDYALSTCKQAVDEFRHAHAIKDPIETIDWTGVYWRRS